MHCCPATETAALWNDELNVADLAEDMAVEARLALAITTEIAELDERIFTLVARRDPAGIIASAPGVGPITSAVILGRSPTPPDSAHWLRSAPTAASSRP